ncbi:hypothetical protein BKA80DRAFT_260958 [Phyllosticta citrichinensis]
MRRHSRSRLCSRSLASLLPPAHAKPESLRRTSDHRSSALPTAPAQPQKHPPRAPKQIISARPGTGDRQRT